MAKQLKLKIVTPEKLIVEELVDSVTMPTIEGEITILPEHIPLIGVLANGDIVAQINGEYIPMAVVGGFIEVKNGEKGQTEVSILADFAEHVKDISEDVIEEAKRKAKELEEQASNNQVVDFEHFETELARSITRVKIADKWKNKKYRR